MNKIEKPSKQEFLPIDSHVRLKLLLIPNISFILWCSNLQHSGKCRNEISFTCPQFGSLNNNSRPIKSWQ